MTILIIICRQFMSFWLLFPIIMPPLSLSFLKVDIRECLDQHFAILQTFGCQMGAQVRGLVVALLILLSAKVHTFETEDLRLWIRTSAWQRKICCSCQSNTSVQILTKMWDERFWKFVLKFDSLTQLDCSWSNIKLCTVWSDLTYSMGTCGILV